MTHREFIRYMVEKTGLTRDDSLMAYHLVFDSMKEILMSGEEVVLPGIGVLHPKYTKGRGEWISPFTKGIVISKPSFKLRFRSSRIFESRMTKHLLSESNPPIVTY